MGEEGKSSQRYYVKDGETGGQRERKEGNDVMGEEEGKQSKIRRQGRRGRWTESEKRMQ